MKDYGALIIILIAGLSAGLIVSGIQHLAGA